MLLLRNKQLPYLLQSISDGDLLWLMEQLELASSSSSDFYIARDTVQSLSIAGASAPLLESLEALLDGREEADVEVVHRTADGGYAPAMIRSQARTEPDDTMLDASLNATLGASLDESLDAPTDAMDETSRHESALFDDEVVLAPSQVEVAGRVLTCVVCGHDRFQHRRAQLHSGIATFFGVEWMGANAECYVCESCGYVHWFVR